MSPRGVRIVAALALLWWSLSVTGVAGATANEAPLADAGLDQTVPLNATVHLDATGSHDSDGEITGYEWTIESPTGAEFEPECGDCAETEFRVTTTGTYDATVRVTDGEGATRSDTLRVTVEVIDRPTVRLTGPDQLPVDAEGEFDARATAGEASLASLEWVVDGSRVDDAGLDGDRGNATFSRAFDTPGEKAVRVRVVDRLGRTRTTSTNVTVIPPADALRSWNVTGQCNKTDAPEPDPCEDTAYFDVSDGTVVLDDGDNDGEYTVFDEAVKEVDKKGQMTDTIRVDRSIVRRALRQQDENHGVVSSSAGKSNGGTKDIDGDGSDNNNNENDVPGNPFEI